MATLKELLGDDYKEDMTIADIDSILSGKKVVDLATGEYVSKGKLLDAERKAKDFEQKYNEKLTDEEKAEADRQKQEEHYKEIEKDNVRMKTKARLSTTIKDKDKLDEITELYVNGDIQGAIDKQTEYFATYEETIRKDEKGKWLRDNPEPHPQDPGGTTITKEQFSKMGYSDRVALYNKDPDLYNELNKGE